jgi:hypothetical protein
MHGGKKKEILSGYSGANKLYILLAVSKSGKESGSNF